MYCCFIPELAFPKAHSLLSYLSRSSVASLLAWSKWATPTCAHLGKMLTYLTAAPTLLQLIQLFSFKKAQVTSRLLVFLNAHLH